MDLSSDSIAMIAMATSVLSALIAGGALAWTISRDVFNKPTAKVTVARAHLVPNGRLDVDNPICLLSAVNHGPGPIRLEMIWWRRQPIRFARLPFLLAEQGVVLPLDHQPKNGTLPLRLDVGETASVMLDWSAGNWVTKSLTHFGVRDSFGRFHWVPTKDIEKLKSDHLVDFGSVPAEGPEK